MSSNSERNLVEVKIDSISDTLTEEKHKVVTPVTTVHLIVFQIDEGRSQHQNYFIGL